MALSDGEFDRMQVIIVISTTYVYKMSAGVVCIERLHFLT